MKLYCKRYHENGIFENHQFSQFSVYRYMWEIFDMFNMAAKLNVFKYTVCNGHIFLGEILLWVEANI